MYLLVASTTGFWTVIDCRERVADAVVDQAGAVPSMILTGYYWKSKQIKLKHYTAITWSKIQGGKYNVGQK